MSIERFGEKVRSLRQRQGMTQRELAAVLGLAAHSYINALETGKKKPTIELVVQIAQLFQVTTDQLLWDHLELDGTTSDGSDE
jgi:transcriptional regulator with XRE-family HTH domain